MMTTQKKDLVTAYHVLAHLKMDDHTYTHLSLRTEIPNQYWIYPFGLCFDEVSEENLLRVTLLGEILEGQEHQYNQTGYVIHGSIYRNRNDVNAILHLHTPAIVAVSAMKGGLKPWSQWALHFYNRIKYHAYNSLTLEEEQSSELIRDLGQSNILMMQHHGVVICGKTIQEAMFYAYHLEKACQTHCLLKSDENNVLEIPPAVCEKTVNDLLGFEKNLGERDWKAWQRRIGRN